MSVKSVEDYLQDFEQGGERDFLELLTTEIIHATGAIELTINYVEDNLEKLGDEINIKELDEDIQNIRERTKQIINVIQAVLRYQEIH